MKFRPAFLLILFLLTVPSYAGDRYAITMQDGSVSIMELVEQIEVKGTKIVRSMPKPEDEVAKWPEGQRAKVVSIEPVDLADIPPDRTFRNAWKFNRVKKTFSVDLEKAKAITKDAITDHAMKKASDLDLEAKRAEIAGDTAVEATVAAKKNALRNVVPNDEIDAAKSADELKAILTREGKK